MEYVTDWITTGEAAKIADVPVREIHENMHAGRILKKCAGPSIYHVSRASVEQFAADLADVRSVRQSLEEIPTAKRRRTATDPILLTTEAICLYTVLACRNRATGGEVFGSSLMVTGLKVYGRDGCQSLMFNLKKRGLLSSVIERTADDVAKTPTRFSVTDAGREALTVYARAIGAIHAAAIAGNRAGKGDGL